MDIIRSPPARRARMHSGTSIGMAVRTRKTDRVASPDAGMERGEGERPGGRERSEEDKKEEKEEGRVESVFFPG